jgi:Fe-S-cluster formation regulator IscX/YfhJ
MTYPNIDPYYINRYALEEMGITEESFSAFFDELQQHNEAIINAISNATTSEELELALKAIGAGIGITVELR